MLASIHHELIFKRRTRVLSERLAELLPQNASVLDVGCGDGLIDTKIKDLRPDVSFIGIDIAERPNSHIEVIEYDGHTIPFEDNSFDVVMFCDVLHHTDEPKAHLAEAKRVAKSSVVMKDHLVNGLLAHETLSFMDWVGNAPHGVEMTYNYWEEEKWRNCFNELGLEIEDWKENLDLYVWPLSSVFGRNLHFVARLGCH